MLTREGEIPLSWTPEPPNVLTLRDPWRWCPSHIQHLHFDLRPNFTSAIPRCINHCCEGICQRDAHRWKPWTSWITVTHATHHIIHETVLVRIGARTQHVWEELTFPPVQSPKHVILAMVVPLPCQPLSWKFRLAWFITRRYLTRFTGFSCFLVSVLVCFVPFDSFV